jgi:hypothetical protein
MMDAAASAISEETRAEFLRLSVEWLKLATEIGRHSG